MSGRLWLVVAAPAVAFFAADAGTFAAMGPEDLGVAGMVVAPAQVLVQVPGLHDVVGVQGVGQGEPAQHPEMHLDRVGPGRVGRGVAQLDVVAGDPAADPRGAVGREVTFGSRMPDPRPGGRRGCPEHGQAAHPALMLAVDAPQGVVTQ